MMRNKIKLLAGLASAGALALTGLVGTQAVVGAETTKTISYRAEENASSLSICGDNGHIGNAYDSLSLDDVAKNVYGDRYAREYLKGYDGEVVIGTSDFWYGATINETVFANIEEVNEKRNIAYNVSVFTQSGEDAVLAGYLNTDKTHPIKIKDGVIYACNEHSFETYILSDDGKELVHKDYVDDDYWGYTNTTNKEENRVEFTGGEEEYKKLWAEYDKASEIDFTIYQYELGKNDSSLTRSGNDYIEKPGTLTAYTSFDDAINQLKGENCRSTKVSVGDYDGDVLAVQYIYDPRVIFFFTQKDGENVRSAGFLYTDGTHPVKIKDGVIYACNENSFETYLITSDGKELVHKDYVNSSNWGYTNDSSDQSKRVDFSGSFNDSKLWEAYNSASEINI